MLDVLVLVSAALDRIESEHLGKLRWSTEAGLYTGLNAARLMQAMNKDMRDELYRINDEAGGGVGPVKLSDPQTS